MSDSSPRTGDYTPLQKGLHWAVVLLLLAQYILFDGMGRPFNQTIHTGSAHYTFTVIAHMTIGVTILAMAVLRLFLRREEGAPQPPRKEPQMARIAAMVVHWALYFLLFTVPIAGLCAWFLQSNTVAHLHTLGVSLLLWLTIAHIAAVIVHRVWWKTGLLDRMT